MSKYCEYLFPTYLVTPEAGSKNIYLVQLFIISYFKYCTSFFDNRWTIKATAETSCPQGKIRIQGRVCCQDHLSIMLHHIQHCLLVNLQPQMDTQSLRFYFHQLYLLHQAWYVNKNQCRKTIFIIYFLVTNQLT